MKHTFQYRASRGAGLRLFVLLAGLWCSGALSWSQSTAPKEHEVKAAFLINFAKFVEWPTNTFANSETPIRIGIMGEDALAEALTRMIQKQTAQGRRLEVRRGMTADESAQCQMIYFSKGSSPDWKFQLSELRGKPILTVGDLDDFAASGGVIGFNLVNKAVRFDINTSAAAMQQLQISSKLLAVARRVIQ